MTQAAKTFIILIDNKYDWQDEIHVERVTDLLTGLNCSPECGGDIVEVLDVREEKAL